MVYDPGIRNYGEVAYENATLISVKPGSSVQCSDFSAPVYTRDNDGRYYEADTIFDFSGGKVDEWFRIEVWSIPELKCVSMIRLVADNGETCFIVPGDDGEPQPEPMPEPQPQPAPAEPSAPAAADLAAITLTDDTGGGYTYYKLRDLGKALNFNVGWSAARAMFVETDKPYTDAD